jgi:hypothetical protein
MIRTIGVVAACLWLMSTTVRAEDAWVGPAEGNIGRDEVSLYYLKNPAHTVVLYFPGQLNSTSSSSQNATTKSFRTDVALQAKGMQTVTVTGESSRLDSIRINQKEYDLAEGALFRVSAKGDIDQLPFLPLEPTREYLTVLTRFFHP